MKNSDYWQKRFTAVENMNHAKAMHTVDTITPAFDRAEAEIEKELNAWYQRFATNNGVDLTEAKKILSAKDLKELKWDINEYIKYGKENALDPKWMKELENASAKFHINRLEALKIRTQQAAEVAFGKESDELMLLLADTLTEDYYHTAFEIQKGLGVGFNVGSIDDEKLHKILKKPWTTDGNTFSDRIWKSKEQLVNSVHTEITQMCLLGKAPDDAIRNISKQMGVSKYQAGRLVMTESAYFATEAQKKCFEDLDVEEYEVVATLDSRTSDICQEMDGKHFPVKDMQAGVTAPPFHPNCRSTTVPYFDDFNEGATRAARGADGKTYQVPADMKYEDWKKAFVDGDGLGDLIETIDPISGMITWLHDTPQPAPPAPKKEYLTKKKLQSNIAQADVEIEDLDNQFESITGMKVEDAVKKYGSEKDYLSNLMLFGNDPDFTVKVSDIYHKKEAINLQKAEWQKKLDDKIMKEQKKVLLKQKADLETQVNDAKDKYEKLKTGSKTYTGIWKDPKTTEDFGHGIDSTNIQGKKNYYEGKINSGLLDQSTIDQYNEYLKQLDELELEGSNLFSAEKDFLNVQKDFDDVQKQIQNLGKAPVVDDPYSQARKDAAYWFKSNEQQKADDLLRKHTGEEWINATKDQRVAVFDYTVGSGGFNRPLRGYDGSWYSFKGVGKVPLDNEGKGKKIKDLTDLLDNCLSEHDQWLQRGVETADGAAHFLGISENQLRNASQSELEQLLIGKVVKDEAFLSCGTSKGTGFSGYIFNIYTPKGTKMMYVEPISNYGYGDKLAWDGKSTQFMFGHEFETLLQRGSSFKITKVEKSYGNVYFDIDLIDQTR